MHKVIAIAKKNPSVVKYIVFSLTLSMVINAAFWVVFYFPFDSQVYRFGRDIFSSLPSDSLFGKSTFLSLLFTTLYFIFKWLSDEKNELTNQNSPIIKTGAGSNVTIVHGNYEGLNQEVLELIKEDKERGYEIELLDYISKYRGRLLNHIQSLTRNSSLNLIIGLCTTIVGVFILYEIFMNSSGMDILGYFSRISIAIFIEISSFFFLRLYSSNLFEIKYFHNELSNIDARMIALKVALLKNDTESLKFILKELMKTERNHLLKKGETTVEVEKMRFDKEGEKNLADTLVKVFEPLLKSVADKTTNKNS